MVVIVAFSLFGLAGIVPTVSAVQSVEFYQSHPAERKAQMHSCRTIAKPTVRDADCANARKAEVANLLLKRTR